MRSLQALSPFRAGRGRPRRSPGRRRTAVLLTTLAALTATATASPATAAVPAWPWDPGDGGTDTGGIEVVEERRVSDRVLDLTVDSPALGFEAHVRLLLPEGWSRDADRTWPALFLLHGPDEAEYRSWTQYTDVEGFLADKDVITVLPSGGQAGFYSDWWNFGLGGPGWETFHTEELTGLLEEYRAGEDRAVAGISLGGFGAMKYAALHDGVFGAAASYSGLLHTTMPGIFTVVTGILVREGSNPLGLWGDKWLFRSRWSANNPYDQAGGLNDVALYVSNGNGLPGPGDPPEQGVDALEIATRTTSEAFVARLDRLGIDVTEHMYRGSLHGWHHWEREFRTSWPVLAKGLGIPAG
ncbi:alpha/beta hydrolase family protein [Streptomyces sp. TRM 70351]|uniref:alpha/beta hydrolase n=1 Tax=Streptomyces sp. TRM 70351 TaxID=3116552 RepID=UPI002E7B1B86|nr:alpha/beta hydrolase family protein [Streptomyces sp. TRM 70351]MEE1930233.1 alpha/beta hydrolase family protein [Streptomyces sp. TRM 70351]